MEEPEKPPPPPSGPVPIAVDGGWGWVVVMGAFCTYFIADGWAYSFGIVYPALLEQFGDSKGKTSIIGALLYGVPLLVSPVVCALVTVYGCRVVTVAGGITTGAAFILSAFATSVDFLCLSTGILVSLGLAMTYIPSIFIVTYYFEKRRGLAIALAVTGSGLGAFAFPPLIQYLMTIYSWRGTLMIFGAISFNIVVAGMVFRPPPMTEPQVENDEKSSRERLHIKVRPGHVAMPRLHTHNSLRNRSTSLCELQGHQDRTAASTVSLNTVTVTCLREQPMLAEDGALLPQSSALHSTVTKSSPDLYCHTNSSATEAKRSAAQKILTETHLIISSMMDKSLLMNWPFLVFCASSFLTFLWIGVPYVYLVDKSILFGIQPNDAAFLLSVIGIARTIGQLVFGFIGDSPRLSSIMLYGGGMALAGLATLLVPVFSSYGSLCFYSSVFGFMASVSYTLIMIVVVDVTSLARATSAFGLVQLAQGIATLLGTPIAGWLFDVTGQYNPSFYVAGTMILVANICLLPIPYMLRQSQPHTDRSSTEVQA